VDENQSGIDSGDVSVIRGQDSVASLGRGQGHVYVGPLPQLPRHMAHRSGFILVDWCFTKWWLGGTGMPSIDREAQINRVTVTRVAWETGELSPAQPEPRPRPAAGIPGHDERPQRLRRNSCTS
jgi:hypothetical protein